VLDDQYAINVAKTELREGYNTGDVERILAVFADSFTDMRTGQASFYGVDAKTVLRASLEKLFRENHVKMTPVIVDITISGDVAVEYGWHRMTLQPKSGGPMDVTRSRYAELWRRNPNSGWQIVFFIDNADQEPELVEHALDALSAAPATQNGGRDQELSLQTSDESR
jgi:ketosteroid isomerase-like protein